MTKNAEEATLILEYTFNAPKSQVWRAYADQENFEAWWGPEGWETIATEFEFKPGGRIHYGMKCVDEEQDEWYGKTSWGMMEIQSIDEEDSFSYVDYFSDATGMLDTKMPALTITNEFIETDGKTALISTCQADSSEQIEKLVEMGMVEGFESQLRKLDEMLI